MVLLPNDTILKTYILSRINLFKFCSIYFVCFFYHLKNIKIISFLYRYEAPNYRHKRSIKYFLKLTYSLFKQNSKKFSNRNNHNN